LSKSNFEIHAYFYLVLGYSKSVWKSSCKYRGRYCWRHWSHARRYSF